MLMFTDIGILTKLDTKDIRDYLIVRGSKISDTDLKKYEMILC